MIFIKINYEIFYLIDLFKRAILMSGSALNPDAIAKAPLQITKQVCNI